MSPLPLPPTFLQLPIVTDLTKYRTAVLSANAESVISLCMLQKREMILPRINHRFTKGKLFNLEQKNPQTNT